MFNHKEDEETEVTVPMPEPVRRTEPIREPKKEPVKVPQRVDR